MACCCNVKGFLLKLNGNGTAQVQGEDGRIYENVFLINPIGTNTIPQVTENTAVFIMKSKGSNETVYGLAFNYPQQQIGLPVENANDLAVGNILGTNKITFLQDGKTNEIAKEKTLNAETVKVSAKTDINGEFSTNNITNLGDAISFVLNQNAVMQVIIPSGSSAGTYQVQILNAGQAKTKA
jgi:hypothetical protein